MINLDNSTTIEATFGNTNSLWYRKMSYSSKVMKLPLLSDSETTREEYHLTAQNGNIHSQIMLLNGNVLTVNSDGEIPPLEPIIVNSSKPIRVAPFSIVFSHIPDAVLSACS